MRRVVGPPTSGRPKVSQPERRTPKLVVDTARATFKGGSVIVPVHCPERIRTGAAATVTLVARVGGRNRRISSKTVDLGSGQHHAVTIRLSKAQRALVRAVGKRHVGAHVQVVDHHGTTGRQAHHLPL